MQRRQFMGTSATLLGSTVLPAWSQTYPDRTIKIYQGFAPGGNADAIARLIGGEISKGLGQAVVVLGCLHCQFQLIAQQFAGGGSG